jgi:L-aminopeptidase/D-esterase-like protein
MNYLFLATVEATEEAIINAMVAAHDMTGNLGHEVKAISHEGLKEVMSKFNRLENK